MLNSVNSTIFGKRRASSRRTSITAAAISTLLGASAFWGRAISSSSPSRNLSRPVSYKPFAIEKASPGKPIEKAGYRSWTLFVICDQNWALAQKPTALKNLYEQFIAFGTAIGPRNLAVWLSRDLTHDPSKAMEVNYKRSAMLCNSLKLPPSGGPYVLFTTTYPGQLLQNQYPKTFPESLQNYFALSLANENAPVIILFLTHLSDQLVAGDLAQRTFNSERYWYAMESSYLSFRRPILRFFHNMTVTFHAGGLTAKIQF